MLQWHISEQEPRPAFPTHCPRCGRKVHVLHVTMRYTPLPGKSVNTALVPWYWEARCTRGHDVAALPEQGRLT
jgi:hypothetical protein